MCYLRLLLIALLLFAAVDVQACPFCTATQQTISEEIESAEISVIARLVESPNDEEVEFDPTDPNTGMAKFKIETVLRGEDQIDEMGEIEVVYFGKGESDKSFLINALSMESLIPGGPNIPRIDWTTPLPLTQRAVDYVLQLQALPKKGADRLVYFQKHLEDEDPLLAQDAYDEFARAPYGEVIDLADRMDRKQLLEWIGDASVGPTRRRLYLTMLGVCGTPEDAQALKSLLLYDYPLVKPGVSAMLASAASTGPAYGISMIDELVRADIRRKQQCLDALIAAYLKLIGPEGLPLVEEKFLSNPKAEYSHIYAAFMALRFHGEETDVLPRERLLQSMRLLLDNEEIADQVVADLSRWEDWSVMDRLVSLFENSDTDGWIRQPVISYLLTAAEQPGDVGERANNALAELEELDPELVKRTRKYMSFGLFASAITKSTEDKKREGDASTEPKEEQAEQASEGEADQDSVSALEQIADSDSTANTPAQELNETPNRYVLITLPIIACVLFMGIFTLLLRGADVRTDGSES